MFLFKNKAFQRKKFVQYLKFLSNFKDSMLFLKKRGVIHYVISAKNVKTNRNFLNCKELNNFFKVQKVG